MAYNKETGMYEGWIYLITNILNKKKYIGQTRKQKPIYRFNEHASLYNNSKCEIDEDMRKYGKTNFNFEILQYIECKTQSELISLLNELEIKHIEIHNTYKGYGYNKTLGGDSNKHLGVSVDKYDIDGNFINNYETISDAICTIDAESITSILQVCRGERNTCGDYVWRFKGEAFDKFSIEDKKLKKVDVYSTDGKFIETLGSLIDAAQKYKVVISTIQACCVGRIRIVKDNYVFRYHNEAFDKYEIFRTDKKPVDVYNYQKDLINKFDSIKEAADYYNTTPITISEACYGVTMTIHGNVFRFKDEPFNKYRVKFRGCCQYDLNGNFIAEYKNQSEASRITGLSLNSIQKCCSGKQKNVSSYIFRTVGEQP